MEKMIKTDSDLILSFKEYLIIDRGLMLSSINTYLPTIIDFISQNFLHSFCIKISSAKP